MFSVGAMLYKQTFRTFPTTSNKCNQCSHPKVSSTWTWSSFWFNAWRRHSERTAARLRMNPNTPSGCTRLFHIRTTVSNQHIHTCMCSLPGWCWMLDLDCWSSRQGSCVILSRCSISLRWWSVWSEQRREFRFLLCIDIRWCQTLMEVEGNTKQERCMK